MLGGIEGMGRWMNSNTHSRDFLRPGCAIFFLGEIWSSWSYCSCSLCITASTSSCFPARIIKGGRLPAASVAFEMWGRAAWHMCSKRCLRCCRTDCMQDAFLKCKGVN